MFLKFQFLGIIHFHFFAAFNQFQFHILNHFFELILLLIGVDAFAGDFIQKIQVSRFEALVHAVWSFWTKWAALGVSWRTTTSHKGGDRLLTVDLALVSEQLVQQIGWHLQLGPHEHCERGSLVEFAVYIDVSTHLLDDSLTDA